jgi:hypothetical protein|tara:strand:+ start:116 stop:445 length:330 start_codon:yes stop_codon:yes gene_type:complete
MYVCFTLAGEALMSNPRECVSIGDEVPRKYDNGGTLDTVVHYDGKFGTIQCQYDSDYRFSFDNDNAFLDVVAEEVEDLARAEAGAWPYHNDGKERGGWRSLYAGKQEEV